MLQDEESEARRRMYKAKFSEIIERAEKMKELAKVFTFFK